MSESFLCRFGQRPVGAATAAAIPRRAASGRLQELILLAVGLVPLAVTASPDEIALVRSMGERGGGSAQEVYRRHSERVMRFIYWRVGEQYEDAEDVTLETFLSAASLCHTFDGRVSVFLWLCGIARLRIIDHHRHKKRAKRAPAEPSLWLDGLKETASGGGNDKQHMDGVLDRISASQMVDLAMRRLTEREREALVLHHAEALNTPEIAHHLDCSDEAARSLIRRAETKLRSVLSGLLEDK